MGRLPGEKQAVIDSALDDTERAEVSGEPIIAGAVEDKPERAEAATQSTSRKKILKGQAVFLDRLLRVVAQE